LRRLGGFEIMPEQLEFRFDRKPESNEEVKPQDRDPVIEHNPAETENLLTYGEHELLEEILSSVNVRTACERVKRNKGAPGIDDVTVKELDYFMEKHWVRISDEILNGTYKPSPVKRVEIPKPSGGIRLLGIPTVIDRVIQQAMQQRLTLIFDPGFSDSSYGFRPGRSAHDAVRKARSYMEEGYYIVVDIDLEKFFDRVNHDILMSRVARKIKDKRVLKLIRRYLDSGVLLNGVNVVTEEGVPQGGPLSPLLANIMLDDLDKELEKRGHRFCRYADDCNVYVKGRRSGERVKESLTRFLRERLKLKVNEEKSAVDRPSKRKFLGFSFIRTGFGVKICISSQSVKKLKDKIRFYTRPHWRIPLDDRMKMMNQYLRGWMGYYALTDDPSILGQILSWQRRRMRLVLWHQWKKPSAKYRNLKRLGLSESMARKAAYNSKGAWNNTISVFLHTALNNKFMEKLGILNLSLLRHSVRRSW
jgi:RNA-directed DNA polymerase